MSETSGVYPCYENQFQINTAASGGAATMKDIADCETFEVSFDNGVEEWTPFDTEGWVRRLMTAKSVTITVTAKRNVGDAEDDVTPGTLSKLCKLIFTDQTQKDLEERHLKFEDYTTVVQEAISLISGTNEEEESGE